MEKMRLLVIGGVAAGASFAARARRLNESAQITVIERSPDVTFANCGLPYHIGGEIPVRDVLALHTPETLKGLLNVDVRTLCEAISIDRKDKRVQVRDLKTGKTEWLEYDKLMLAPGAAPRVPDIPGVEDPRVFTLRNLDDMDRIIVAADAGMRAVVAGAGFIGLEMAEQLHLKGLSVEVVQVGDQVLSQLDEKIAMPLENALRHNNIKLHLNDRIASVDGSGTVLSCQLQSGGEIKTDFVVLSIGVEPESRLARDAGLKLGERGHIVVSDFMETDDPDIYAAGDVIETSDRVYGGQVSVPLGGPANRQGRVAADHIFFGEKARPYPGSIGTAILRLFDVAAGCTGWTEQRLQAAGRSYKAVTINDYHHATYFPGALPLTVKILWEPKTGILLGGQVSGHEGVDKRLDVMATAISGKMTIEDLCHLELAYAPPFNAAKDAVNLAGFAATNMEDGLFDVVTALPSDQNVQILDIRGKPMAEAKPISTGDVINIPMPTLRANLDKLDRSKPVITVCMLGKNSYFAARILAQNGFDVKSLDGGITSLMNARNPKKDMS